MPAIKLPLCVPDGVLDAFGALNEFIEQERYAWSELELCGFKKLAEGAAALAPIWQHLEPQRVAVDWCEVISEALVNPFAKPLDIYYQDAVAEQQRQKYAEIAHLANELRTCLNELDSGEPGYLEDLGDYVSGVNMNEQLLTVITLSSNAQWPAAELEAVGGSSRHHMAADEIKSRETTIVWRAISKPRRGAVKGLGYVNLGTDEDPKYYDRVDDVYGLHCGSELFLDKNQALPGVFQIRPLDGARPPALTQKEIRACRQTSEQSHGDTGLGFEQSCDRIVAYWLQVSRLLNDLGLTLAPRHYRLLVETMFPDLDYRAFSDGWEAIEGRIRRRNGKA